MALDVFDLRDDVVNEYRDYVESFVNILDPRIDQFVRDTLATGELWPDAVLQLNPAYERGGTLAELANQGVIARETARFFDGDLRLHRHQQEALEIALRGEPYLVSTGTGSGKSLAYLLPIVDQVFRHAPTQPGVRAIIVYPMNALINSQLEALEAFQRDNWPDTSLRFRRYTGQEGEAQRQEILDNPPHILLTNYVMLEYMLLRPFERTLLKQATRNLQFLVLDELHVYRGRQGADVAMLMRRVRQRAGGQVQVVGTSATIASRGNREQRRAEIAQVGSTLFGVPIPAQNVVDETLQRIATVAVPGGREALRAAVEVSPPAANENAVKQHPLTAWVEETFGLTTEDGRLIRRPPISFAEGRQQLVDETGLSEALCEDRLRATLETGNRVRLIDSGEPLFAFRLHQFLASGSSIYATVEEPGQRALTVEGQVVLPSNDGAPALGDVAKLLYPLAFCRDCGQEHYLVSLVGGEENPQFIARSPLLNAPDVDSAGAAGFLVLDPVQAGDDEGDEGERLWTGGIEEFPEHWLEERKTGWKVKRGYEPFVPTEFWVKPDGTTASGGTGESVRAWYSRRPLMLCLRCRAAFDRRDKSDFRKLATLSQTGRSTATTVLTSATIGALRRAQPDDPEGNKVLSFTDNRQDASLQAGHLNDFAQVTMMRGALARALESAPELRFWEVGARILEALDPKPADFMREPRDSGPGFTSARQTMVELLTYRAFEDLRRAWRVAQPNLEQVGRLQITYTGLQELAEDDSLWRNVPGLGAIDAKRREEILKQLLDHLRGELAIDAESLQEERTRALAQQVNQWLRTPWTIDRTERLRHNRVARLPGAPRLAHDDNSFGMSATSMIGRFLRSRHRWGDAVAGNLTPSQVDDGVYAIVQGLAGHILTEVRHNNEPFGVQLKADALRWTRGSGESPPLDPVRSRAVHQRRLDRLSRKPNVFFDRLYGAPAALLAGVVGREHTGQVASNDRILREEEFRKGQLPALFCSPTMELGVDIRTLNVVHMRNVPPTPANYAQRGGRAGRGGRPALVLTFASQGNAHDTYFFRRKERVISGAVAPARMDLANRELVQAHLQAVWLAATGVSLGSTVERVLDLGDPSFPIQPELRASLGLNLAQRMEVIAAFREIASADPSMTAAAWFDDAWLVDTVEQAPVNFDRAFDRWRELYRAALQQRNEARMKIDRPRIPRREREGAERMEREAKRDIDLLLNDGDVTETDFYPYRYMATEGFLPGYNFPRLPLRVLLTVRDESRSIDRPRFLGLSEFGPWNVIYHEGRKYRVTSQILPAGGLESRITSAQLCKECGYIHPDGDGPVNICQGCGVAFDAETRDFPQGLLEQSTARARPYDRISSDEEDRSREGYTVTTHFQFAPGAAPRKAVARLQAAAAEDSQGQDVLAVEFAPRADVWRINHGWKRSVHQQGFTIDPDSGWWAKKENDEVEGQDPDDPGGTPSRSSIKPYVTDNRNVLLLRPETPAAGDEAFLKTLAYALQRGIQVVYQVEEREVEVELIGRGSNERLMLWEAAEGGTGVWDRIMDDPTSLSQVAKEALRACHFDEDGEPDPAWASKCALACYDCLLSYSNQREHRLLNRHLVRGYLIDLAGSTLLRTTAARGYDEHFAWLMDRVDPGSSLERDFLTYLYDNRMRLPDSTQTRPVAEIAVQTDFYYERDGRPGVCVFLDGPHHQDPQQAARDEETRDTLEDRGFRVIVIRSGVSFAEQTMGYGDVFGKGR